MIVEAGYRCCAKLGAQSGTDFRLCELAAFELRRRYPVKPDDHSEVVPLLPIPNRTVKRLSADDSADARVKVGHCQANIRAKRPCKLLAWAFRLLGALIRGAPNLGAPLGRL